MAFFQALSPEARWRRFFSLGLPPRTIAGGRAAGSHTAALAGSDVAVEALFRQTGVIRAETLEEMFDLAAALGSQPVPKGRRVAIVTFKLTPSAPIVVCC